MDFPTSIKSCFSKYATFSGRASCSEFWWWTLFTVLSLILVPIAVNTIYIVASSIISGTSFLTSQISMGTSYLAGYTITLILHAFFTMLSFAYPLALILPSLAVLVRRLHDAGYSGWLALVFILTAPICFIGIIMGIIFCCKDSTPEQSETTFDTHMG